MDAFGLYGKTTRTFQQNWKELYGSLPAGKYRLGKDYFMNKEEYWVYCEFEITEETGEGDDTTDYFRDFFKFIESMPSQKQPIDKNRVPSEKLGTRFFFAIINV